MTVAHISQRVASGGAFGYYEAYPIGDLSAYGINATASFESGLQNTWKVTTTIASGVTMDVLFGQSSSNPAVIPIPNLFDVNVSFSGSVDISGIDVASLELRSDYVKIDILGLTQTYTVGNLSALSEDLERSGISPSVAAEFVNALTAAMSTAGAVENTVFEIFEAFDTADFSNMQSLVNIDLTSGMTLSSEAGTPTNIGQMIHVNGTAFDDKITGSSARVRTH